jgi:hypothetical protein
MLRVVSAVEEIAGERVMRTDRKCCRKARWGVRAAPTLMSEIQPGLGVSLL